MVILSDYIGYKILQHSFLQKSTSVYTNADEKREMKTPEKKVKHNQLVYSYHTPPSVSQPRETDHA